MGDVMPPAKRDTSFGKNMLQGDSLLLSFLFQNS